MSVLRAGALGWRGWKFLVIEIFFPQKHIPGVVKRKNTNKFGGGGRFWGVGAPHSPTRGSYGVGKRYTSSYDHDM